MKIIKINIFLLFIIFSLFSFTNQTAKCNIRLLKSFLLSGMKFSVYSTMQLCQNVHDKCCSLSDEIKIYKLWTQRVEPMIDTYSDTYFQYLRKVLEQYKQLMDIDPRLIILKYVSYIKVPLKMTTCSAQETIETMREHQEFLQYNDNKLKGTLNYEDEKSASKMFDNLTKNEHGERHWSIKDSERFSENKFFFDNVASSTVDTPFIEYRKLTCQEDPINFDQELVVVNEQKANFCMDIYEKFLNLDINSFRNFLPIIKNTFRQIQHYKKSFYCGLCDVHQQKFISVKQKKILISQKFCQTILIEKKAHFEFVHVLLIELFDSILQYMTCFETKGDVFSFPFQNFLQQYKRRIPYIKDCLSNLNSHNFMAKCWFICDKFQMLKLSPFYDGDLQVVKRMYLAIISFLRKIEMSQMKEDKKQGILELTNNVDGMLIEPINPAHLLSPKFYGEKKVRKKVLGTLDTRKRIKNTKVENRIDQILKQMGFGGIKQVEDKIINRDKLKKQKEVLLRQNKFAKASVDIDKYDRYKRAGKELKPNQNPISKLINKLATIKREDQIHAGHFPQRELLQDDNFKYHVGKTLIEHGLSKKYVERKLEMSMEIMQNKIEAPAQFYLKNLPPFKVAEFKIQTTSNGMNPILNYSLINFDQDITTIIANQFKKKQRLNKEVVLSYFSISPKMVNGFNHSIFKYIKHYQQIPYRIEISHQNNLIKKAKAEKDKVGLIQATRKKRKYIREYKRKEEIKENAKMRKKYKEQLKEMTLQKKFNEAKPVHNHVTVENFHKNFSGFKDLFISLFGS